MGIIRLELHYQPTTKSYILTAVSSDESWGHRLAGPKHSGTSQLIYKFNVSAEELKSLLENKSFIRERVWEEKRRMRIYKFVGNEQDLLDSGFTYRKHYDNYILPLF